MTAKKKKKADPPAAEAPPPPPSEPLAEDPESQPRKGKRRGAQQPLPVVFENVKKYPTLEKAMGELSQAMRDYAAAGKICQDQRKRIETIMIEHNVSSYGVGDLLCTVDPGAPKLKVKRLSAVPDESAGD